MKNRGVAPVFAFEIDNRRHISADLHKRFYVSGHDYACPIFISRVFAAASSFFQFILKSDPDMRDGLPANRRMVTTQVYLS
jgi:hypothetical protein